MGCEWSARRQSANRPPDQQIWSWSIRYGSNRAGRMAVTEHIPGLSAMSPEPTLAAGARVMPTRAWLLVAARLDQGRDRWIAWSFYARSPWVWNVWGCMPPSGGSGAAAPGGALRAIDASAQPQSWRTCGPRRLQRQSQPALIAAQGDAAANRPPQRRQADQSSRVSCTMAVPGLSPPWAAKRAACADGPLRVMLAHLGTSSVASRGPAGRRWIDAAGEEEATRRRHRR